jgi:hypothetical protein
MYSSPRIDNFCENKTALLDVFSMRHELVVNNGIEKNSGEDERWERRE